VERLLRTDERTGVRIDAVTPADPDRRAYAVFYAAGRSIAITHGVLAFPDPDAYAHGYARGHCDSRATAELWHDRPSSR
jgi:hypothetical protein